MRLTTRSTTPETTVRRPSREHAGNPTIQLDLDPREVARDPASRSSGRRCCRRPRSPTRRCSSGSWSRSSAAGSCAGHVTAVDAPGKFVVRELGTDSVVDDRRRGRPPARLPQRLPPPRRADRRGDRGPGAQAPALSLPRLVLRARRRAAGGPAHGRGRGLRLLLLGADRRAARGRRRPGADRPLRRGARGRRPRRRAARPPRALPAGRARPRPADQLRGRRELEGDRRELQRVPALPRRPPGAQRAQRLHERRGGDRRGRLVRRLDDPARGAATMAIENGGPRRRPPADRGPDAERGETRSSTWRCSRTRSSRCTPTT